MEFPVPKGDLTATDLDCMSDSFNAYHVWLGIPSSEQPPDHYRLLGITEFETDLDVIDHAADRQMAHVRTFQSGRNGAVSQQILNELASARLCLLNSQRKADYDKQLRARRTSKIAAMPVGKALPVAQPAVAAIPRAAPLSKPAEDDEIEVEMSSRAPLASQVMEDDEEPLVGGSPFTAPPIEIRAPLRLVNRDASLQRALVYVFVGVVVIIVVMVLLGMLRRIVSLQDLKQWFSLPSYSAPSEPRADESSSEPPPEPPAPAPPGAAPEPTS